MCDKCPTIEELKKEREEIGVEAFNEKYNIFPELTVDEILQASKNISLMGTKFFSEQWLLKNILGVSPMMPPSEEVDWISFQVKPAVFESKPIDYSAITRNICGR